MTSNKVSSHAFATSTKENVMQWIKRMKSIHKDLLCDKEGVKILNFHSQKRKLKNRLVI